MMHPTPATVPLAPHSVESYLAARDDNFLLLRIIATLAVIYGHSFAFGRPDGSMDVFILKDWGTYSGDLAVDIFFVISGFMVSGSFIARAELSDYVKARLLRIVPAYLACLFLSAYAIGPLVTTLPLNDYLSSRETLGYVLKNARFSSDMAWTLPGVFAKEALNNTPDPRDNVASHSWWTFDAADVR